MDEAEVVTVTFTRRAWQAALDAVLRDMRLERETDFAGLLMAGAALHNGGFPDTPPIVVSEQGRPS